MSKSSSRHSSFGFKKGQNATTNLEHVCGLTISKRPHHARATGVICTLGPASRDVEKIKEMIRAGMNVARLNFSHGTHDYHAGTIANIRQAVHELNKTSDLDYNVAIALDTKGPEIRTGLVKDDPSKDITLETGKKVRISLDPEDREKCTDILIYADYTNLNKVVKEGSLIYIDDGLISLKVEQTGTNCVDCHIENGGKLGSQKGVNLPKAEVDLPALSEKDKSDLLFGIEHDVDMIFASFIRKRKDLQEIKKVLGQKGEQIYVISKVENEEGVSKFDEILEESDGIMVARGDMGIEIPPEKVFLAQKMMIAKCNIARKPVICATQMLDSMTNNPRPTRAEVSDVANAVLDGADCVMLSGESAKGKYPVESVRMLHKITREAEEAIFHSAMLNDLRVARSHIPQTIDSTVAAAAVEASIVANAQVIIVLTTSGKSAYLLSTNRPKCPIIAVTRDPRTARQSHLYRGVHAILYKETRSTDWSDDLDERVSFVLSKLKKRQFVSIGDVVVIVTGWRKGSGFTNTMRIITVA